MKTFTFNEDTNKVRIELIPMDGKVTVYGYEYLDEDNFLGADDEWDGDGEYLTLVEQFGEWVDEREAIIAALEAWDMDDNEIADTLDERGV